MERPRFRTLRPEGNYNASKDIVERLLLDSMADEAYILQTLRGIDDETRAAIAKALDNIAARSRHLGQQLLHVINPRSGRGVVGELADSARAPREESLCATFRASCAKKIAVGGCPR
jgi:hypothetical protein